MSEQLLTILRISLLVLLYLFFLRVLRAVWAEVREPNQRSRKSVAAAKATRAEPPAPTPKLKKGAPTMLVVLAPAELAGAEYLLADDMTIGRATGCGIVVNDSFVSSLHSRVFQEGNSWKINDAGSTNGTFHNTKRISNPVTLKRGDRIDIGNLALEVR